MLGEFTISFPETSFSDYSFSIKSSYLVALFFDYELGKET